MKNTIRIVAVLMFTTALLITSCHKFNNNNNNNNIENFVDLSVSPDFKFESFSNLETAIKVNNNKSGEVEIIQIYDAHPNNGGKVILTGSVNQNGIFDLPIRVASRLSEVYVGKLSSLGQNEFVEVPVTGTTIQLDFSNYKTTTDNDPCTSGCTNTYSGTTNDLVIHSGEVICVLESTQATFNHLKIESGGVLRVCGNVSINTYKNGGNGGSGTGTILVNDAGTVNMPKHETFLTIENYGQLNFSGCGEIRFKGTLLNWGDVSSSIKMKDEGSITNDGTFSISKEFEIRNSGNLINNCQFYVTDKHFKQEQDGNFTNNGYLKVNNHKSEFKGKNGKKTILGPGSLIETYDFKIEGVMEGPGTNVYAQITAANNGEVMNNASISGYVDLCASHNTTYHNGASYGNNVTYCTNNITTPPICDANVAPTITSSLQLGGLVNQGITPYVMTATGTETISYSVGTLPSGLSFDANTHTISGTPTSAGTFNVEMTATNFMGSDTKTLVIEITQPTAPPVITSVLTDNTTVNESYTYTLTASGTGSITYDATSLPAGLLFNPTSHQITGIPTSAGIYNINLSATNVGGTTTETLVLTVGTPPTITSILTASGTAGVQFTTYTVTASGSPTITYSAANLPAGLSFDPDNQTINGTPTYSGVSNVTLTATNTYGTDVQTLVVTVNQGVQPPVITSSLTANANKDNPFSYSITADGSQPMTYNATNLPAGLSFNGSVISGIPTATDTYNITISATNSAGTDTKILVLVVETGGGTDTDGDGIPDNLDAYPNDPTRAFNSFYPNENDFGSLAYEDLWPGYGDYDFNDFVVNFNYQIVTNSQNKIVDVIAKFQIMADGASQNNGFGIVFDAPSSSVESVTGCMKFGNAVQIDTKGFEVGHTTNTVIIPFDAINLIMEGGMVNTTPGGRYIQTTINTVITHFGIPQTSIGTPPYNPFIFIDQERGYEIHLKNQPPTNLVDPDYFSTFHDVSVPATGSYYISTTGLPWAIEIPQSFEYPIEKADVVTTYLKFAAWAQSSGVDYSDWYLDNAGYRNEQNIYVIPQ